MVSTTWKSDLLERYLNDKNLIPDRETASIFRLSAEIFESDFR